MTIQAADWLTEARASAMDAYRALPDPDRVNHLWRYSDPAIFLPAKGTAPERSESKTRVEADPGCEVMPLAEAALKMPALVREHLGRVIPATSGKLEALNAATWSSGIFVRVPRGIKCGGPIRITSTLDAGAAYGAVRNLILIEEDASATIVEDAMGDAVKGARRIEVTEIIALSGSEARLVSLQRIGREGVLHRTQRVHLGHGAHATIIMASLGAGTYKADIGSILEGEGSESRMIGVCFGDGKQRADHHTLQDHRGPHTSSDIDFRAVLGGRAQSCYTGLIRIAKEAPYCEAYQENRNLLLSDSAKAHSIPELEIMTDEVRCKHGATVGPIDQDQMFYLRSRGLTAAQATEMIVNGFFEKTLAHIPEDLAEPIRAELASRLAAVVKR
jgi:Fe-S cluster assembly protein SufD